MTWIPLVNVATACLVIANVCATFAYRRVRYQRGWLDGRIDLLEHMARAHDEGLDFDTFMRQVAARDGFILPGD